MGAVARAMAAFGAAGLMAGCAAPAGGPSSLLYRPDAARWQPAGMLPEPQRTAQSPGRAPPPAAADDGVALALALAAR